LHVSKSVAAKGRDTRVRTGLWTSIVPGEYDAGARTIAQRVTIRMRRLTAALGPEALVIVVAAVYALIGLALLSYSVGQDTWLALVGGRSVAGSGLPAGDVLTAWTQGVHWVDQQWLGQFAFYGLASFGGLKLAYVLFVAVVWLSITDSGRPSRRALWIAPVLALWTNIHGSVVLGAALVVLSGAICVVTAVRVRERGAGGQLRHGALLLAIGLLAPLVSPYGPAALVSYYGHTLFNGEFGKFVIEWASPRPSAVTAAFYLLGALALWLIGRSGTRLTPFERALLLVTLAAGLDAIRNIIWFALAAAILLPVAAERAGSSRDRRAAPAWLEAGVATIALLAVVVVASVTAAGSATGYQRKYPPRAGNAVWMAAQRDRASTIYADEKYADWLLWRHPDLAGRIVFDARFELLSDRQLHDVVRFNQQAGAGWRAISGNARILVLDNSRRPLPELPSTAAVLGREGRFQRVAQVGDVVVLAQRRIDVARSE